MNFDFDPELSRVDCIITGVIHIFLPVLSTEPISYQTWLSAETVDSSISAIDISVGTSTSVWRHLDVMRLLGSINGKYRIGRQHR